MCGFTERTRTLIFLGWLVPVGPFFTGRRPFPPVRTEALLWSFSSVSQNQLSGGRKDDEPQIQTLVVNKPLDRRKILSNWMSVLCLVKTSNFSGFLTETSWFESICFEFSCAETKEVLCSAEGQLEDGSFIRASSAWFIQDGDVSLICSTTHEDEGRAQTIKDSWQLELAQDDVFCTAETSFLGVVLSWRASASVYAALSVPNYSFWFQWMRWAGGRARCSSRTSALF